MPEDIVSTHTPHATLNGLIREAAHAQELFDNWDRGKTHAGYPFVERRECSLEEVVGEMDAANQKVIDFVLNSFKTDPDELLGVAEAVSFYADPENWHGVYMMGNGPMADDWDTVAHPNYPDGKPGKRARDAIEKWNARA